MVAWSDPLKWTLGISEQFTRILNVHPMSLATFLQIWMLHWEQLLKDEFPLSISTVFQGQVACERICILTP